MTGARGAWTGKEKTIDLGVARELSSGEIHLTIPTNTAATPRARPASTHVHTCMVAGNKKSKIYHVPGGQFYRQMATTSKDKVCFRSEAEAGRAEGLPSLGEQIRVSFS